MINFDTDMDEETQPTIPSGITAEPVSDIDAQLVSHMLPKVVNLANQVSPEIRQTHSEIFSRLPIVVIHRYEPEEKLPVEANDSTVSNVLPNISKKIKDTKDSKTPIKLNVTVDSVDTDMDEETQPTIPSGITAEPVSDIDAKLVSHMLPKVVNLANQVSPEIRQTHSEIFSRLPIVLIHRYEPEEKLPVEANDSTVSNVLPNISKKIKDTEDSKTPIKLNVTVDSDELSILPNEPSSSILANNDPTIYSNQPLLNESLENNKTKTYGPIDNLIEEQTKTCNLNMNLQDGENQKLNTIVPSVENVNDQDANNIKIKKEIFESTDDVNDSEELNIKKIVKHIYAKTIKHSNKNCENELNVDVIEEEEMKNKPTSTKKIINFDHDFYKTLSPESLQKEKDDVIQLKNKIVKNMTSLEPELINHMKDYEEYVVDEPQCNSPSLSENTNINQMVESDSVDTLNETPTSNAGKVFENIKIENESALESENLPGYFKYYDDQMWNEFSKDVKKAQECIMPSFLNILAKDDLTFEEMDKLVTEKVSEIMQSKFDAYFENKNKKFMEKKQEEWHTQYTTLLKQLDGMNAFIDKHKEDVKNDPNATPQKLQLRRHVKVQTKQPKSKTLGLSTQTLINNDSDGTSLLPTCSSSVSIQSNPTAAMGMPTQTLINNDSDGTSLLPTCSSSVSIQTNPTATLGTSTQYLSNNTSNFISMLPTYPSSFQPAPQGSTQTVIDPRRFTFTTNTDLQNPSLYMINGNNIPIRLYPGLPLMNNMNSRLGNSRICNIQSLNPSQNIQYLRPVPPAIPIEDDEPTVSRDHIQELPSLKQSLQAPTKRSLPSKTSKEIQSPHFAHEVDEEKSEVKNPSTSVIPPNSPGEKYFDDVQAQRESEDNHQQEKIRTVRQKKDSATRKREYRQKLTPEEKIKRKTAAAMYMRKYRARKKNESLHSADLSSTSARATTSTESRDSYERLLHRRALGAKHSRDYRARRREKRALTAKATVQSSPNDDQPTMLTVVKFKDENCSDIYSVNYYK